VAGLVSSINESVDALEGLFGELLDITRIDTGGVEVAPAPVRYYGEPRWHERHHFYHHDYRDRRFYRDYRHDRY